MKRQTLLFTFFSLTCGHASLDNDISNTTIGPLINVEERELDSEGLEGRIVGGDDTPLGRYPYQALLGKARGASRLDRWWCSGTLIAPDIILSASHCAGRVTGAMFGAHTLSSRSEDRTVIRVKKNIMHPSYSSRSLRNDIAVFVLKKPYKDVDPVSINVSVNQPQKNDPLSVVGWGELGNGQFPDVQQHVEVLFDPDCGDYPDSWITQDMMCAGANGKDACSGDSGGPIIDVGDPDIPLDDVQVGVVSWGDGCAEDRFPGVYSRISHNYAWVRDQVCLNSNDPPATFNCESDDTADEKEVEERDCDDENPQFWWGVLECDSDHFIVCLLYADFCKNTCDELC